ncbi:sugar porter family MFS transporter [Limosilactobacillus reuteri]|uniref:Sugar porter family MFS transporter n=1 Tax=Limosilactobacillus reuteri TaxID=1598 RepID=A0A517D5H3_LIMRT|nr:sugar porter family MFS transporter [Limosilactobacillus reuteri]QDR72605.1 sugar porter family MFS transporter [Limosilactobacillus reuteri]
MVIIHRQIVKQLKKIAIIVTLGGLLFGVDTGVINGAIPYMASPHQLDLSSAEEGLVTSGITLGAAIGALIAGRLADKYGRKHLLTALSVIFFIGTLLCATAPNALLMIIYRFFLGLAVGGASTIVPTYLAEISTASLRGQLVTQNDLMITGGQLLAFTFNAILGTCFPNVGSIWRYMLAFGMIPALCLFIGMWKVPESPRWLVMIGKQKSALRILQKVRPNLQSCQHEISSVIHATQHQQASQHTTFKDLSHPWVTRLILIGVGLGMVQQFVGINIMMYYGTSILMKVGFGHQAALIANIGNGLTSFVATAVGMHLMATDDRRKMLLTGICGTLISMVTITFGITFLAKSPLLPYIVICSTMCFLAFFQSSISPTTWTLLSEIYPQSLRGLGMGISTFALWISNFLVGFAFPIMLTHWGGKGTFAFFILCNIASLWFTYHFAPETQGKALEQIQAEFQHKQGKNHHHHRFNVTQSI